jgi:MGT family glycosyltransferase
VTVGPHIDPSELGPQPPHVRVEGYLPQAEVLPGCDVVVTHGGSGSVLGALAHGLPLVVLPMGADQPLNAARCEAVGVGRSLDALGATPADVRDAVAAVLHEPSYRRSAERLRDEIAALPEPAEALKLVEALYAREM